MMAHEGCLRSYTSNSTSPHPRCYIFWRKVVGKRRRCLTIIDAQIVTKLTIPTQHGVNDYSLGGNIHSGCHNKAVLQLTTQLFEHF